MPKIDLSIIEKLPPETQKSLRSVWQTLTPAERESLASLVSGIPSQTSLLKMLLRLSSGQFRQTFGRKSRVAIVGPANVGKSTLYNQLIQHPVDKAEVSPLPGTTRQNQVADAGLFTLIDTPGADAVGEVGQREQAEALSAARQADFLIIVFDSIQGIKQTELDLYNLLVGLGKPYIVVMNKLDLVRKQADQIVALASKHLDLNPEQVIPVSAKSGENLAQVITAIAVIEPQIVAALGQALPQYRWQLAWRSIISASSISAVIALTPLPVIDFAPLVVTQSAMVLGIARIYNYEITLQRARELVATFGLGLLGRTLFQQLSKLAGVPGWILSAAVAASTTIVMGYAAVNWFEKGERLSKERLNELTKQMTAFMLERLKGFGKKKPGKKGLREAIEKTLEESPMAQSREIFDQADTENADTPADGEEQIANSDFTI